MRKFSVGLVLALSLFLVPVVGADPAIDSAEGPSISYWAGFDFLDWIASWLPISDTDDPKSGEADVETGTPEKPPEAPDDPTSTNEMGPGAEPNG